MDWLLVLSIIFGGFIVLLATGLPVAFCFLLVNAAGVLILWGGGQGMELLILSMWHTVATFLLLPVVMFILLGEVLFRSGMALRAIDVLDGWLGRLPGRLGLLAVVTATLFSTMSGSTVATTAMLGEALVPEMERRGYKKPISIGSVMGSGGLAMLIPPSGLAIVWAVIARVSVGKLLIAIIVPGLIIATFYALYVVGRCKLQPSIAPAYDVTPPPLLKKLTGTAKYVLPFSLIIFSVTGLIFVGVATPSEAAVIGVVASLVLAVAYRKLDWKLIKDSLRSTLKITSMVLLIVSGAQIFSQILAFSGAARGMVEAVMSLPLPPIIYIVGMVSILLILGMFMTGLPMMLITLPLFMPIIISLGFNQLAFGVVFLICIEMGNTTPPFGVQLFVMQGVAPKDTTMWDIIKAGIPFLICDALVMALVIAFPVLATWLPGIMQTGVR